MMIKLKESRETIGTPPFCKHAGSRLLPNAPNIPNCGLVLKLARYHVSRALEASLNNDRSLQTQTPPKVIFVAIFAAHLQPLTNVPTTHQLPTPHGFQNVAWTRLYRSRSLRQGQIKVKL